MRKTLALLAMLALPAFGQTGNVSVTYTDFQLTPQAVKRVTQTPLQPFADYGGAILSAVPRSLLSDTNGVTTFTNTIYGYSYRITLDTPYGSTVRTCGYPATLTGNVNARDYLGELKGMNFYYLYQTNLTALIGGVVTNNYVPALNLVTSLTIQDPNNPGTAYLDPHEFDLTGFGVHSGGGVGNVDWTGVASGNGLNVTNVYGGMTPFRVPTRLVFVGASLTGTAGSPVVGRYTYPFYLTNGVMNMTNVTGVVVAADTGLVIASVTNTYWNAIATNAPAGGTNAVLFYWQPMNDLYSGTANLNLIVSNNCAVFKNLGYKVVVLTQMDIPYTRTNVLSVSNVAAEQMRRRVNLFLRSATNSVDRVVDADSIFTDYLSTTYDSAHQTSNNAWALAVEVARSLNASRSVAAIPLNGVLSVNMNLGLDLLGPLTAPWVNTSNLTVAVKNGGIQATNESLNRPGPALTLFHGSTVTNFSLIFGTSGASTGDATGYNNHDAYAVITVDPNHDGGTPGPDNSEAKLFANRWAFGAKYFQFGVKGDAIHYGGDPFLNNQCLALVDSTTTNSYSLPHLFSIDGQIGATKKSHYPSIYARYVNTNGPDGTYYMALANRLDNGFEAGGNNFPDIKNGGTNDMIRIWGGNDSRIEIMSNLVAKAGVVVSNGNLTVNFSTGNPVFSAQPGNSVVIVGSSSQNAEFEVVGTVGSSAEYFRSGQFGNFIVTGGLSIGGYRGFATDVGAQLYVIGTHTNAGPIVGSSNFTAGTSMIIRSNTLATWPTIPPTPGACAMVNSNGYPFMLLSTNGAGGGSATWTGTNKLGW